MPFPIFRGFAREFFKRKDATLVIIFHPFRLKNKIFSLKKENLARNFFGTDSNNIFRSFEHCETGGW